MVLEAQTEEDAPSTSSSTITCHNYRIRRSRKNPSNFIISKVESGRDVVDSTGRLQATLDYESQAPRCLRRGEKATMFVQKLSSGPTSIRFPLITVEYPDIGIKYSLTGTDGLAQWFYNETPIPGDAIVLGPLATNQLGMITSMFEAGRFKLIPQDLGAITLKTVSLHRRFEDLYIRRDISCPGGFTQPHNHTQVHVFLTLDQDIPGPFGGPGTKYTYHSICETKKLSQVFESLSGGQLSDDVTLAQVKWEGDKLVFSVGKRYTYHEAKNGPPRNLATAWAKNVWPPEPIIREKDRIDLCLMAFESPEKCDSFQLKPMDGNSGNGDNIDGNGGSGKCGDGKSGESEADNKAMNCIPAKK